MKLDEFRSRRPIDIIAKTNPVIIIDEPQSVEGKQTKAYHPENLTQLPNLLAGLFPEHEKLDAVIRIVDVSARNCIVYHDLRHEKLIVTV